MEIIQFKEKREKTPKKKKKRNEQSLRTCETIASGATYE